MKVYKVPIGFTYTLPWHLDSLEFYVLDEGKWQKATVEKEVIESWGGYGKECGGTTYRIKIIKPSKILPVAVGYYSYQVCTPRVPDIKNYAVVELRFEDISDVRVVIDCLYCEREIIFKVRDLSEFIEK